MGLSCGLFTFYFFLEVVLVLRQRGKKYQESSSSRGVINLQLCEVQIPLQETNYRIYKCVNTAWYYKCVKLLGVVVGERKESRGR